MRKKVESLDSSTAGNWVSVEILDATLARRLEQLADDPDVPLFFGRIDRTADMGAESFHIGRRHISDSAGDPMVVDWRAPVSVPFYRASRTEPMGLARRRRYGFSHGDLTAFEDESLTDAGAGPEHSAILEAEIERPRVGPMRDIVATIQPEQDVLVRADLSQTIVVQGAPGTGKTAVGLHRAAYLLYAHRDQLTRRGVLIIGPNASFLRYIRDVLPALGEIEAKQATIAELVAENGRSHGAVRAEEPAPVATLKGDVRMAEVLRRAVWSHVGDPEEALVVPRGSRRWRVPTSEAREALEGLRANDLRYAAGPGAAPARPGPPGAGADGALGRLTRRQGARRGGAGEAGQGLRRRALARSQARPGPVPAVHRRGLAGRGRRRAPLGGGAGEPALAEAAALGRRGALVAGRPGAPRRDRRPARPHAVGGPHRRRRGPGPVRDDAARARPPFDHGLADDPRRPRPGDHAVGLLVVGRCPGTPRQARRPCRAADAWVPGPGRCDRLRGPPPPPHRPRPGAAGRGAPCAR